MILLLLLILITQSRDILDYILLYSSETSEELILEIGSKLEIHSSFNLSQVNLSDLEENLQTVMNALLIDITENQDFFPLLDQISQTFATVYLTLTQAEISENSEFRFYLRDTLENIKNRINEVVTYLNWEKFSIFSSTEYFDILLASSVKAEFSSKVDFFLTFVQGISDNSLNTIVKKSIKASGTRKLLIIGQGSDINRFQYFIKERKLEVAGTHFLFCPEGIHSAYLNGSIILSYPGTEQSKNEIHFKLNLLENILQKIDEKNAKNFLAMNCANNICIQDYNIINIQNGKKVIVGTLGKSLNITIPIIYPGQTTSKSAFLSSTPIIVSIANGTSEPNMNITDYSYASVYTGAEYAVLRSNLNNEIPNFHIELTPTDCGNGYYNESLYESCFSKLSQNLGIAYLTSLSSIGTKGNYKTLKYLKIEIPQLSPLSLIEELNNKTEYPNLLKLGMSNYDYGESFLLFLLSFNWNSIIFFGSNDTAYKLQYFEYLNILKSIKVKIVNPEEFRLFPETLSREQLADYKEYFEFAKSSKCRIYLLATPFSGMLLEGLYDVGLRKEDVIVYAGTSIYYSMSEVTESKYKEKRQEFLVGINIFTYKEWIGELGEKLYGEITSIIPYEPTYLCITYDSVSVLKYSINHLLNLGEDYESTEILMKSMRLQRLTGCMGTIFFLSDSNVVATFQVGLGKLIFNKTSNQYFISFYATSNKYDTQIIKYSKEIEWPSGEDSAPSNFIDFGVCGLDERIVRPSQKGKTIVIIISCLISMISVICAWLSTKIFTYDLYQIEKGREASLSDYSIIFYMFLQSFQILALGSNNGVFKYANIKIHKLIGMNWISLYDLEFFKFWKIINMYLILSYIYILLMLIPERIRARCFGSVYLLSRFNDLIDISLPIIGHYLFIPVVSSLMSIFSCSNATGDDLIDSYLDRDCNMRCYSESHLRYSYSSGIALFLYVVLSVLYRPDWDMKQVSLSIITKVNYYAVQSVFQVLIVTIQTVFDMYSLIYSGVINGIIIILFFLYTIKSKPYNYERGYLVQKYFLMLTSWCVLLASFFDIVRNKTIFVAFYFSIIGLFVIFGIYSFYRIEDSFSSPQKSNIETIFKKYMSKGSFADENESKYLDHEHIDNTVMEDKGKGNVSTFVTSQQGELGAKINFNI